MSIKNRLLEVRSETGLSQAKFAQSIGTKQQTYATWESISKSTIPSEAWIERICNKYSVNYNWLLTGEGEMYSNEPSPGEFVPLSKSVVKIPYYHQGVPSDFTEYTEENISSMIEVTDFLKGEGDFLVRAADNSMNSLGIHETALIFVKRQSFINRDGQLMLIAYNNQSIIRKVFYDKLYTYKLAKDPDDKKPTTVKKELISIIGSISGVYLAISQ